MNLARDVAEHLWELRRRQSGDTLDLSVPAEMPLDEERVAYACQQLGRPWQLVAGRERAAELARDVTLIPSERPWPFDHHLQVGSARLTLGYGRQDAWCNECSEPRCVHRLALSLAVMAHSLELRHVFTRPLWELMLLPHAEPPAPRAAKPEDDRHEATVRYRIAWPLSELEDARGLVVRQVIRRSKRTGKPLKPVKMPRDWRTATSRVRGLTSHDRAIHLALDRLDAYAEAVRYTGSGRIESLADQLTDEALREVFEHLSRCEDVWLGDRRVTVRREPLMPRIVAGARADGTLELGWSPEPDHFVDLGPGFVAIKDVIRPLHKDFPRHMWRLLSEPLPDVPAEEVGRFVERFALRSPVPMELDAPEAGVPDAQTYVLDPTEMTPRLVIGERLDVLTVDARFAYRLDHSTVEIAADDRAPVLMLEQVPGEQGPRLLRRKPGIERAAKAHLLAWLPEGTPAELEGMEAWDFLVDALPRLAEEWEVFGEDTLKLHKVLGAATPSVTVSTDVDWFDVRVRFVAGEVVLPTTAVIKSWLAGKRYHKLSDGSVARLPERWLARHGHELAELEDIRRVTGGKLGPAAAPLAADLLAELPDHEGARRWRRIAGELQSIDRVPPRPEPPGLEATMRDYQRAGFRWLAFLRDHGLGGVLADDMGLGKTLQALAVLLDTHRPADGEPPESPSLVVAPASVIHHWVQEARRFAPALRVHLHHGGDRAERPPEDADLVVTSYALLRADVDVLSERGLTWAILDEAQNIKNPQSKVAKAARSLPARHRLALTGTPLENNLFELWSLFQFTLPSFFGSKKAFTNRYARPIHRYADSETLEALRRRTRPFLLRRLKSEVAAELPERSEQVLYCDLGPAQRALYDRVKRTYRDSVMDKVTREGMGRNMITVLEALMRLRQAACDPRLVPFDEARTVDRSAKLELLFELVESMLDADHRALVFSQWPSLLKLVAAGLTERGVDFLYLDGSTTNRQSLVERFQAEGGPPLFLISLKAGGTGLNLTAADHVVHLDPWWNPAAEAQATDRAHRIGQTRPVVAYKLVARDTVEEKILELQERKRALFEAAVDRDRLVVEELTREDLEAVFS